MATKVLKNFYLTPKQSEWIKNHKEVNIQEIVRQRIDEVIKEHGK